MTTTRDAALERDRLDPLAGFRQRVHLPPGRIYLDGNSLGALPVATPASTDDMVRRQWGHNLIAGWNQHDWIGAPQRLGARIAPLIGAAADAVIVCDTVSVNLFKLIAAALAARPGRRTIVTEAGNFPTDLYMARGVAGMLGDVTVRAVPPDALLQALDDDTALLLLTHVHYRTGRMHDMAALTAAAHAHGALMLWDLSHSAGAVPVALEACDVDLAVGCGYKFLCGGPGAPAFLYAADRLHADLHSPLQGWMGHAEPFAFDDEYRPADGMSRFLCGTPPMLAMAALEQGLALFNDVPLDLLFAKGQALCDLCIALMSPLCEAWGFTLATPTEPARRGSQVAFAHPNAWPITRALIARDVVGDFRAPDLLRLGMTPLYTRFVDVFDAVERLRQVMAHREWDRPEHRASTRVT